MIYEHINAYESQFLMALESMLSLQEHFWQA